MSSGLYSRLLDSDLPPKELSLRIMTDGMINYPRLLEHPI